MSTLATQEPADNRVKDEPMNEAQLIARNNRIAVLKRIAGIWATRYDIPADSVEYQRQLRAEWR